LARFIGAFFLFSQRREEKTVDDEIVEELALKMLSGGRAVENTDCPPSAPFPLEELLEW
jgi:hypothetical protein